MACSPVPKVGGAAAPSAPPCSNAHVYICVCQFDPVIGVAKSLAALGEEGKGQKRRGRRAKGKGFRGEGGGGDESGPSHLTGCGFGPLGSKYFLFDFISLDFC